MRFFARVLSVTLPSRFTTLVERVEVRAYSPVDNRTAIRREINILKRTPMLKPVAGERPFVVLLHSGLYRPEVRTLKFQSSSSILREFLEEMQVEIYVP